jgi:cell division protein FtsL
MNSYVSAYRQKSVEIKHESRRNFLSAGAILMLCLLAASFLLVYKHAVGQQFMIEVQELNSDKNELITEQSVLLGQKQAGISRSRIVSYAREQLDLEFPNPERIRWIRIASPAPLGRWTDEH